MLARLSLAVLIAAGAALGTPVAPARANDTAAGALIGGATGALIGGAVSGTAGGAVAGAVVGGTAGAIIGNQSDKKKKKGSYYFWSGGKCFYRYPNGQVVKVSKSYC
ncbi:glycine zipper domain-containing protein [Starkeya koreensis]|uniref:Glycine zipper domain-containing protein n=1 Tax=Ancylobacter koreensis TaxID=266121 RepID=A0ABT0DNC9_9HYPH|nr:glycine zipper domain-containing protein [Ancylobacter koreensis]MCK0208783.1 glycine zipper domain-containing protein [Ancylobacter koreensis]